MTRSDPSMSRRGFLRTAAAAAVLPAVLPATRAAAADADPFGGFVVGVQSYTFRKFDLEQMLKRTKEAGLGYAEFYPGHVPTNLTPEKLTAVKKLCGEYGVVPIAFGVVPFSKNHDANKKLFDFAQEFGVKYLSADPDPDSFDSLDKLVEATGIKVGIHPHGPAGGGKLHRWSSAEVILKAVKDHHPGIGTCLDTGHLIRSAQLGVKLDPAEQITVMGARNFGLHLKDHDNKRRTDVPYGDPTGVLDVGGVLKALKDVKFAGYISIEYEANPDNPSPDVGKCVTYFQTAVKKLG
ncbi:MAG: sugar phosphate isomerase/epimerase family protein [Fimbriiglobus sp.]